MAKKQEFKMPYLGVDIGLDFDLLYSLSGDFSIVIKIDNPIASFSADERLYASFHELFLNIIKILGEEHYLQKLDILSRVPYAAKKSGAYLQNKFDEHFKGRLFTQQKTLLVITKKVRVGAFYTFDKVTLRDFKSVVAKVIDVLLAGGMKPVVLREKEINRHVLQTLSMNFVSGPVSLDNYVSGENNIGFGSKRVKCLSLINIDHTDLPTSIAQHGYLSDSETLKAFPVDLLGFLSQAPNFDCIVFNQAIEIPSQRKTLMALELKRKRHSGIPDPANNLCVEDISSLLEDVARENRMLIHAHFNVTVCASIENLDTCINYIESNLFAIGIIPSKNAYNQMELFRTILPGNSVELKKYDWFLTTAEAALCLFFKERPQESERSDFLIEFTDRRGIPIGIDLSDLPMRTGRINNRNKFVLGPSGSGKSFLMNTMLEQYMRFNMDLIIVDTGHSYFGLCMSLNGKYITYSDDRPITMNPFLIDQADYNIEKKDFLLTLLCLCLKGADGKVSQVESDVISVTISAYYSCWFSPVGSGFLIELLCFDSFYDFAIWKIPQIIETEGISFDIDEFRFILKKFYRGGEFDSILNEAADSSLFLERFIVFEIDNIKEHKILFPIVTLIIMDVFIQKMRRRNTQRKALIIEEAWKAVSSPIMASYLVYLFKTVRKFWGEVIPVTQDLEDIIGNEIVKNTIISASDTVILLDQTKFRDNYKEISALLSISEVEQKKIFSINQLDNKANRGRFKEVYIRRGSVGEVYGVEVSLHQYLTFTTEKPEKVAVERYRAHYGDFEKSLDRFVVDFYISKLTLGAFVTLVNQPDYNFN